MILLFRCSQAECCIAFKHGETNFKRLKVGNSVSTKIKLINYCPKSAHTLMLSKLLPPFHVKHSDIKIKSKHYVNVPITFEPQYESRNIVAKLKGKTDTGHTVEIKLCASAFL